VLYVHAPQVWEGARWGVHRPGWGGFLERHGERPHLLAADVVLCVSEEVAAEVRRIGVTPGRVHVSPMAVDPEQFSPDVSGADVKQRHALGDRPVVGWAGSFRAFHGLDHGLRAFRLVLDRHPDAAFLLVGGGSQLEPLRSLADDLHLGDAAVFTGPVPNVAMPEYIAAMDVPLVLAPAGAPFHYSPLKLREFMSAGKPSVAPRIGDVARTIEDGRSGLLYEPGDVTELADAIGQLLADASARADLGRYARAYILREGTWERQLDMLLAAL
jgi:glycosyltransferase involved in cell wall biosynthesis